jgi:predicted HicB family RNase H-like nuclease
MSDSLSDAADRGREKGSHQQDLAEVARETDEKETTTRYTIDFPDSLHKRIKMQAVKEERSMKDLLIDAMEMYLNART